VLRKRGRKTKAKLGSDTMARLGSDATQKVEIAEYLMLQYIRQHADPSVKLDDDMIFKYAVEALNAVGVWVGTTSSDKGKIMEKIVARVFMRHSGKPLIDLCNVEVGLVKANILQSSTANLGVCGEFSDFRENLQNKNPAVHFFSAKHENIGFFPGNAFGPDFGFHASYKEQAIPVCVQVKCKKGIMTYSLFVKALQSLNLSNFYESSSSQRTEWQAHLDKQAPKVYIRIVYNFLGFADTVIAATTAYNKEVKNVNYPLVLIQGDKLHLGGNLFSALFRLNKAQGKTIDGGYDLKDLKWR